MASRKIRRWGDDDEHADRDDGTMAMKVLMRAADQLCPYSLATCGNIEVSLTVNGRDAEATSAPVVA